MTYPTGSVRSVTTADPVSVAEIAERLGVSRDRVKGFRARGAIPDPDWTLGVGGIWAWERLSGSPIISKHLDPVRHYGHVLDAVKGRRGLVWFTIPDEQVKNVCRRIERHGHGWATVPLDGGRRLVVTDDPAEEFPADGSAPVTLKRALEALATLFREEGVGREPAVSPLWEQTN